MPPGPAPASAPLAPASQATPVVPSPAPTAVPVAPAPTAPAPSAPAVAPLVGSPSSPDARHIVNPPPQQGLGFAQAVALQSRHVGGMTAAPNAPLRTSLNLASALPAAAASPGHGRVEEAGHVAVARLAQGRSPGPQSGFQGYGGGNAAPVAPQRSPAQNAPQALPVNASPNAVYSLHAQTLSSAPQDSYQGSRYDAKIEEQPIQDLRTKCGGTEIHRALCRVRSRRARCGTGSSVDTFRPTCPSGIRRVERFTLCGCSSLRQWSHSTPFLP